MKKIFQKIKNNFSREDGFTLAELLVSSTISIIVIASGYTLSMVAINANSSDKARINLNNKIDNSFNYLLDEIQSGKSLIKDSSKVPSTCRKYNGLFVLGINLPKQAIDKSSYSDSTDSWKAVNCPIIYSLEQDVAKKKGHSTTFKLLRKGPSINKKGFYISANPVTTIVTDSIDKEPMDDLICSPQWSRRKIAGLIICFDPDLKSAEIAISARNTITPVKNVTSRQTSGSFSRIYERQIMGDIIGGDNGGSQCNVGCQCNMYGTQIKSDRVSFSIDTSGSMSWYRINGKTLMEHAKSEAIRIISCLKDGTKLQIDGFDHRKNYCFPKPITLNSYWRNKAINCVSKMYAWGGTYPWNGLNELIQDQDVGQAVVISDGVANPRGYCFHTRRYGYMADCYKKYNEEVRASSPGGKVRFDTISIKNNFCGNGWLGMLASRNDGECSLIK